MSFKINDFVVVIDPCWHEGINYGGRLGQVVDTKGHVLVRILDEDGIIIKCFQYEIEKTFNQNSYKEFEEMMDELEDFF